MSSCCELHKNNCYSNIPYIREAIMGQGERVEYAQMLFNLLSEKITPGPQTFGFEYEFISGTPLNLDLMQKIYMFLPETGFKKENTSFIHESGMYIDFEPGGQIEFHTPPLLKEENENLRRYLNLVKKVIEDIKHELGIEYLARGYIPGRIDSPLCLDAERYVNLHNRLAMSGTRGLEMMKGTASIHFHAGIRNMEDLPKLFGLLISMSHMNEFKMGAERRDIWNNTDPHRCGQPFEIDNSSTPFEVVEKIADHALKAEHIGENKPFIETGDISFDAFMYHLTTIFTDIRLNIKGPSLELRTIDSVPFDEFEGKWNRFISIVDQNI